MTTTICTHCSRTIGYKGATICPYCGKAIAAATSAALPRSSLASSAGARAFASAAVAPPSAAGGPAVPETASKGLRQLRNGLDRLLKALRGGGGMLEFELALGEVAVALALLRASDGWDVAEAGLDEALREFLLYKPEEDDRGRRIKSLQDRLRAWFGERVTPTTQVQNEQPGSPTRPASVKGAVALQASSSSLLRLVDQWTFEQFDLHRLQAGAIASPTVFCETLEEFYGSFFAYRTLSPEEQARGVREEADRARKALAAGGGAVLGVNWPGRGCFLNGEAFARMHGKRDAQQALRDADSFPHILSTAVHEKLGHGLLTEFTTRGKEIRSVHLEQHEVARHFLRRKSDDPREALLQDKWNILLTSSKYAEEGFATWMEAEVLSYAVLKVQGGVRVDEATEGLAETANIYPVDWVVEKLREQEHEALEELAEAVAFLAAAGPAQRREVSQYLAGAFPHTDLTATNWERDEALDQLSQSIFGQPLHYVVGYTMIEKLEHKFGASCVPFALALAGNVSYGLEGLSNSDLRMALEQNPQLRMDVRLALLGTLDGVPKNDPDALYEVARRELSLTPPALGPKKARV